MRVFYHSNQKSFFDQPSDDSSFKLKIICDDGVVICDRLVFILWSKLWRELLDPNEAINVVIFPDVKQRTMELVLSILSKGNIKGFESDFQNVFELALDFLGDLPGGFSNFETSDKSLDDKAISIKSERNKFKTSRAVTCEFCLSTFATKQSKDNHTENHHQPKELFTCTVCNLTFKSKQGLLTHIKIKHSNTNAESHCCRYCNEKFTNEANLKRHIKSKHDQHDFKCLHCMEVFETKSDLLEHQRDTKLKHTAHRIRNLEKMDVFECSECDFKTSRKDSLARHKRLKHQIYKKEFKAIELYLKENSKWTCSKCGQSLTGVEEVEDHVINCKQITCKLCNKKFTLKSNLKRHLEKKHPFICKNCSERFKNQKTLRNHMDKCLNGD